MVNHGTLEGAVVQSSNSAIVNTSNQKDPDWKYCFPPNPKDPTTVVCTFCSKTTQGGVFRQKEHLIGKSRNVEACKKCPDNVREEIENYVNMKKMAKAIAFEPVQDFDDAELGDDDDVDELEIEEMSGKGKGKRVRSESEGISSRKRTGVRDSQIGKMFMLQQEKGVKVSMRQTNIKDSVDKELRARTVQEIADFCYEAGLPFNVARLPRFKSMLAAVGRYGSNLKPPSYHELRVSLLKIRLKERRT